MRFDDQLPLFIVCSGADFKISDVKIEWANQMHFNELGFRFQGCDSGFCDPPPKI